MYYRKEIDGLRAIAVMPVIFFHAGFSSFGGGYIGVDIFFVISGYLITSILLKEMEHNKFSLQNFYERRARRILPALSAVLIVTSITAYCLMPAELLKSYSQSVVSVVTFSSNIFFYLTNGYFSTASDEKPLLHTWSLAVEEQYYLFFPIFISALWFKGKKYLCTLIFIMTIISLLFAQYLAMNHSVDANFYLILSRAWELFVGSLIAFLKPISISDKRMQNELGGIAGLFLIIYSIVTFSNQTPFPSFYTLAPVLGTGLIIRFSHAETYVGRFLGNKLFVSIGLISYSLYLWHQPIFAFLRLKTVGEPQQIWFYLAVLLTFVLAITSYWYIEKPFRNKSAYSKKIIFQLSGISISLFFFLGMLGYVGNGFEGRLPDNKFTDSIIFSPKREACHTQGSSFLKPSAACRYFRKDVKWASFGDSHVVEPTYALAKKLEKNNLGILHLSFSGCPPALLFEVNVEGCSEWIKQSLVYLENNKSITNVLLGFRYSEFLFGGQQHKYPELPNISPENRIKVEQKGQSSAELRELYWSSFYAIVQRLINSGKTVHLIYPIPELPLHVNKAISPFSIFSDESMLDLVKSISIDYYMRRNEFIINKLNSLAYGDKLYPIKPHERLCRNGYCSIIRNGNALYFDDNHLSLSGAALLIDDIQKINSKS